MPAETAMHKPATVQYFILAVLFLITAAYQAKHLTFIADYLGGRIGVVRAPGSVQNSKPIVSQVEAEAARAGLKVETRSWS